MIRAPFPYFGSKFGAASLLWQRFGDGLGNYVEPFFGSGAVYLNRPDTFDGWATLNDLSGHVANFWRAMAADPDAVARAADWPVHEADLHARHLWLVTHHQRMSDRLAADPAYFEAQAAGWWAWGACLWIGGGWCSGDGPWHAESDEEGVPVLTRGNGGKGVARQLPHLGDGGTGVARQLPHLGDGGTGVMLASCKGDRLAWLTDWFRQLQARLRDARIACGSWERICSPGTMTRNGTCAVLLDPPYSLTKAVYAQDSNTVSSDVREWCKTNGSNPLLRIALCGHAGEGHEALEALGWTVETWDKTGGYQGADDRERIWFSPHCIGSQEPEQLGMEL